MTSAQAAKPGSVLAFREASRAQIEPFLEPGEQLQVVVPATAGLAVGIWALLSTQLLWKRRGTTFLLVATDRAWLPLAKPKKLNGELTAGPRGARSVRPAASGWQRFDGLDQRYSINAMFVDFVRAANEALDAMQAERPWDLASSGDWVRQSLKQGGNTPLDSIFRF